MGTAGREVMLFTVLGGVDRDLGRVNPGVGAGNPAQVRGKQRCGLGEDARARASPGPVPSTLLRRPGFYYLKRLYQQRFLPPSRFRGGFRASPHEHHP